MITVIDGFAVLVGSASVLHIGIWLASLVTHFELADGTLTFSRPGRRTKSVSVADVVTIDDEWNTTPAATVWLRNGTTLYFPYDDLANSEELIAVLRASRPQNGVIEGCLNRGGVAGTLVHQWLISCLLLAVAGVGLMMLAVALRPRNLVANPSVFLLAGSGLTALCATGFYFVVPRFWLGCVHSFRWDGRCLEYRTVLSRTRHQCLAEEIETAVARRSSSSQGEAGTSRLIRLRDGSQITLQIGILQNAESLFRAIKVDVERRADLDLPRDLPALGSDHLLWPVLEPYLGPGEKVYWIGRPVYGKLWNEMLGEMVFGVIPFAFGVGFFTLAMTLAKNGFPWILLLFGTFFGGIGATMMAAPWRYRRMLKFTVYAVTSRRVLIVNGFQWGSQSAVQPCGIECESFDAERARLYQVVGRRRDILLGGVWKRGRRNRKYWVHTGFLAADDPAAAELALRCFLASSKDRPISA
ncbi:MAG: hypothetical protein R3C59_31745 [Planctomycetaceae bacterium]